MVSKLHRAAIVSTLLLSTAYCTAPYDAIIVGAGPAGIIVADKLSAAGLNTLLLEKGGPSYSITGGTQQPDWLSGTSISRVDVPGLYSSIFSTNGGLVCTDVSAFQACTIGGNTAINAGLYFQPPSSDFSTPGWGPTDFAGPIQTLLSRIPSTNNPSSDGVRYVQDTYAATKTWLQAAGYAEVDLNAVPNSKQKVFGHTAYDYKNQQRGGPVISYLQSALARPNFTFRSGVNVATIQHTNGVATGVITDAPETIPLSTNGAVILSGGPLFSPATLYKSGIGPTAILNQLSIATAARIVNENVGKNLYDNPNTFWLFNSTGVNAYSYTYDGINADKQAYLQTRTGPYTFAGQTMAFWDKSGNISVQGTVGVGGFADFTGAHDFTINIYGTAGVKSRGSVTLNANGIPGIGPGVYYSDPADALAIATVMHGILQSLPASMKSLNVNAGWSVAQIQSYITTGSTYAVGQVNHWGGSCKMAASTAEGGCADLGAKVFGTQNVFVVDSSIVNAPQTVNPQFGVMAYAELASDKILASFYGVSAGSVAGRIGGGSVRIKVSVHSGLA